MSDKVVNRNRQVLEAALVMAQERGFALITRDGVAEQAGVAAGSVNNAYGNMDGLRDAVMAAAVERAVQLRGSSATTDDPALAAYVGIIGQGLAAGHPAARNAPDDLKRDALAKLAA